MTNIVASYLGKQDSTELETISKTQIAQKIRAYFENHYRLRSFVQSVIQIKILNIVDRLSQFSLAKSLATTSLDALPEPKDKGLEAQFNLWLGIASWKTSNYAEALTRLHACIENAQSIQDKNILCQAFGNQAIVSWRKSEYENAILQLNEAVRLAGECNDAFSEARWFGITGAIHHPMGNIFLITGIAGTGIKSSLEKFVKYSATRSKRFSFLSIDDEVIKEGDHAATNLYPKVYEPSYRVPMLPREYLKSIWRKAIARIEEKAKQIIKKEDIILTFHCCYYSSKTREYISPVDYSALAALKPKHLVTFIDDIYDCQNRLIKKQFFDMPESLEDSLFQLFRILDWRMTEIVVSGHCADYCGIKHYLLPIKHPLTTLFDLLYSKKRIAYFSHPITEPRQMIKKGLVDEAERIIAQCQELVNHIKSDFTVMEPATVDELRMWPETGKLYKRWSKGTRTRDDLLWAEPEPAERPGHYVFPYGWNEDDRDLIPNEKNASLLKHFIEQVTAQVNTRDHKLVEQSDIVIAFRPLYKGKIATGVQEELHHIGRLRELNLKIDEGKPTAIICCPKEDITMIPHYWFWNELIPILRKEGKIVCAEEDWRNLERARDCGLLSIQNLLAVQDPRELGKQLHELLLRHNLHLNPSLSGALDESHAAKRQELATEIAQQLLNKKKEKPYLSELQQKYGFLIVETTEELIQEVRKFL
ncbi:MAG: hypothetical protein AB1393_10290 [Candidatus Edwardsbacteria bacterium]